MRRLLRLESDVFFITERLKEIDQSYEVYYNLETLSFEVHSSLQPHNSYCFKVPYDCLDERTLFYALKTRSENRDLLIKEIEKNNQYIYEKNIKNQVSLLKEALCQ